MRKLTIVLTGAAALMLTACADNRESVAAAPPPPGSVPGSVAADRDGDGIIDGYYTADGIYHPNTQLMPPPPPPQPTRRGERG